MLVTFASTVPTGSCCNAATCSLVPFGFCSTGTFTLGQPCTPNPCGAPSGLCCRGATCNATINVAANCSSTVVGANAGAKFVAASNTCNTTGHATNPCCYADYNKQSGLTVQDVFDMLNDWFAGSKFALTGGDGSTGTLSVQNIFDFLNDWFAGGCS
jgi:hypothetical protein